MNKRGEGNVIMCCQYLMQDVPLSYLIEVELLVDVRAETKGVTTGLRGHALVDGLLVLTEVGLDNVEGLAVNLVVLVLLAVEDLLHTTGLLDEVGGLVDGQTTGLLVLLTDLQEVLEGVQGHLDDSVVGNGKQVTQWLYAVLSDQVSDDLRLCQTSGGGVGDSPTGFLLCLVLCGLQDLDQSWDDVGVNHSLDLLSVTGSDVGDGPAGLLLDGLLLGGEQVS